MNDVKSGLCLRAFQKVENSAFVRPCGVDAPGIILFELNYPGQQPGQPLRYEVGEGGVGVARALAQQHMAAMERVFQAGKAASKQELQGWLSR